MKLGNKFGTHRVIEPQGVLPQAAWKIDNSFSTIYDNEILINVKTLNIDSASFKQIEDAAKGDEKIISDIILKTIKDRGKQHNPITGSGGMLMGTIEKIGDSLKEKIKLSIGDEIATLVSLSLTPLTINKIIKVRKNSDQVDIEGKAILFESGIYAKLPSDLPHNLALSVLDVAGAAPQVVKWVHPKNTVVILGAGGKSGILCSYQAKKQTGSKGSVIGIEFNATCLERAKQLGFCDVLIEGNAQNPLDVFEKIQKVTKNEMADVTINCVNVPDTEMASILATKKNGTVYFFSMATSFTKAALGAEGIGYDVTMLIGNGYTQGHAEHSMNILRESKEIRQLFEKLYC